jgi:hypothetical protein
VMVLGILAGLRYGTSGVALGYSGALVLLVGPLVVWAKHGTGITNADYWDCIKRPLLAGVVGGASGWLFKVGCYKSLAPLHLLAAALSISFSVYALLLLFVMGQKDTYVDLVRQLFQRERPASAAV